MILNKLEVPFKFQYTNSMKIKEPENKKEIHAAVLAAYKAVANVQKLVTPEVKAWAYESFDLAYADETDPSEVVVDIMNIGQNLIDIGNELNSEE